MADLTVSSDVDAMLQAANNAAIRTAIGAAAVASPTFTGTPAAPTASSGTNTTQLATTAFVTDAVSTKAPIANPTFTGTPAAPTASSGTSTTQLATTAFVADAVSGKANIANPTFTGTPAAPTASLGTNTTQLASTAFVQAAVGAIRKVFGVTIDGGGSAPTTGVKGYWRAPAAGVIKKFSLLADQSGSAVIDVWKDTYANYPPTVSDTITASAKPTLSSATKAENSTLTGWTTSFSAGDVFGFNLDSVTTCTRLTLTIEYEAS